MSYAQTELQQVSKMVKINPLKTLNCFITQELQNTSFC